MDWSVCSREFERDYAWDDPHASPLVANHASSAFAPAFEGSLTASRFAALLRSPKDPGAVLLCVSVSTVRKDFRNRPIRTMAVLRGEGGSDKSLLAAFFAECIRRPDAETLSDAGSDIAKAVESLYQTKDTKEFIRFCESLPAPRGTSAAPTGAHAFPRGDAEERRKVCDVIPLLLAGTNPFLIALTDRAPDDVLSSFGDGFNHGVVRIFSKQTAAPVDLREDPLQKYGRAATIGCVVLLVALVAASIYWCCSKPKRNPKTDFPPIDISPIVKILRPIIDRFAPTNTEERAEGFSTNAVPSGGSSAEIPWLGNAITNAPPSEVTETTPPESEAEISRPPDKGALQP